MIPVIEATGANSGAGNATSLSLPWNNTEARDDLLLQFSNIAAASTITGGQTPSGGTKFDAQQAAGNNLQLNGWRFTLATAAPTAATLTASAARIIAGAQILIRNGTFDTFTDGTITATAANTFSATGTVTPTGDASLLVCVFTARATAAFTVATPAGWTLQASTEGTASNNILYLGIFTKPLGYGTAGVAQPGPSFTSGSQQFGGATSVLVAVRPVSVGGVGVAA